MIYIIIIICPIFFLIGYFVFDKVITDKRLKISQIEWNEFSKNHDLEWKREHILSFIQENKLKHNWKYFYIPKI